MYECVRACGKKIHTIRKRKKKNHIKILRLFP